ncbi:MAG: Ku protein [Planctomycetota bacterium]|nr:Ku protein [Planctomycetota bacterium]
MAAGRAVWKGHLRFNMVVVPVAAYTAAVSGGGGISFNQIHRDCNQRIKLLKTCPVHGEVRSDEIVKGYEYEKGNYAIIDPSEIEKLKTKGDKSISIDAFVGCDTIDPRYFNGSNYYLLPDGMVSQKPYNLLVRAMTQSKRYGFAKVFFSGHDQLVLVRPVGKTLVMSLLAFEQEMKSHHEFEGDVADVELPANEMKLARTLIDAMSVTDREFDFAGYRDTYQDNLRTLVEAKIAGREVAAVEDVEQEPRVINLMEALEKSLAAATSKKARKPPKLVAPSPAAAAKGRKRKTS